MAFQGRGRIMPAHIAAAGSVEWSTPAHIVAAVKEVFGGTIELDPCSNANSVVGARVEYRLPANNGLQDPWAYKTIYVNPPYGRTAINRETQEILAAKAFKDLPPAERAKYTTSTIYDWIARCDAALNELDAGYK